MTDVDFSPTDVRLNSGAGRFELPAGDETAFINFRVLTQGEVGLIHTEVPEPVEGVGVGSALVEGTLVIIRERGWSVLPYCPFAHGWMKRNPEFGELVSYRYPKRDELRPPPADDEAEEAGEEEDAEATTESDAPGPTPDGADPA